MSTTTTTSDIQVLGTLLDRVGVTDLYDALDPWNDLASSASQVWRVLEARMQPLMALIGLGQPVPVDSLTDPGARTLVDQLVHVGLARHVDERIDLGGLALYRYGGCWLFADRPSATPTLYFGADSVGLASRVSQQQGGRGLDLCAGPGIQSLVMASRGYDVDAVEINPVACELFRLNAQLNGLERQMTVACGNLYDADGIGRDYDLIVTNPPLLPIPAGFPYPFVGDGGPSGLDIARRVLSGSGSRLSRHGTTLVVCAARMRGLALQDLDALRAAAQDAGIDVLVTIIQSYPVVPDSLWVRGVAMSSLEHTGSPEVDLGERAQTLSDLYVADGTTAVCSLTFRAWPGSGDVRVQDFSDPDYPGSNPWLVR
jgi:hypothetical protein